VKTLHVESGEGVQFAKKMKKPAKPFLGTNQRKNMFPSSAISDGVESLDGDKW
jgi:hypothetical protein